MAVAMGHTIRVKLTREDLLVLLANHDTTQDTRLFKYFLVLSKSKKSRRPVYVYL